MAERCGAALIDFDADESTGEIPRPIAGEFQRAGDAPKISAIARFGHGFALAAAPSLSFLWDGTGRTAAQALIALHLLQSWVCSVSVGAMSDDELREVARAPLAPALTDMELAAFRSAERRPALAEA